MLIGAAASPWQAMTARPWRFLFSAWPWRSLAYLASGAVAALPTMVIARLLDGAGWATVGAAVLFILAVLVIAVPLATVERRRLWIMDGDAGRLPHGHGPAPRGLRWLRVRLRERATWREFGYSVLLTTVLAPVGAVVTFGILGLLLAPVGAVLVVLFDSGDPDPGAAADAAAPLGVDSIAAVIGLWLVMVPLTAYLATLLAAVQAAVARRLLTDGDAPLAVQVLELARSRTRLVDAFEAERSRIERDLHDGAQQRLVTLIMTLGLAELSYAERAGDVAQLLTRARREAEAVLGELHELIRGIHPQVLTDRGIGAAVAEITDRCPIPVEVRIDLPGRPARAVESIAYFAVSEALANVVKHAGTDRAEVIGTAEDGRLVLLVRDHGIGGADPAGGTGLQGLADRVAVVGGTLRLTSPHGGPTELRVELPWRPADSG